MGNGALLMRALGHEVCGADVNTYPPMSDRLEEAGIPVFDGYDADRLASMGVDLVVVGNVNTRGNPEVEWLLAERKIRTVSLPQLLSEMILRKRSSIVISGTHGKTTTTAIAAYLLRRNGVNAGFLIGGVPFDFESGAELGDASAPFVIEGDEYDSAFFDKRSKFIHYCPNILVINNLEFDHADIYRDLEDIRRTFSHVIKLVPSNGFILANSEDAVVEDLLGIDWAPILRVGTGERADLRILIEESDSRGTTFSLKWKGRVWDHVRWPVWGEYNIRNAAMAALAAGLSINRDDPTVLGLEALAQFRGVQRRQEQLLCQDNLQILTDFAHHPTAVKETLEGFRKRFEGWRIWAVHEARSNTACRKVHEAAYAVSYDVADRVYLGPVYRPERYGDNERIDLAAIARRLGDKARHFPNNTEVVSAIQQDLRQRASDCRVVVAFFSNGSFDGIPQMLADALSG